MTEKPAQKPETDYSLDPSAMAGFTDLSGPAVYKAQKKDEDSGESQASPETVSVDASAEGVVAELVAKITKLEGDVASANDQLLRTVADMENLRKRSVREREDAGKYAVSGFAKDLLDVADTFRRALDSIPEELKTDEKVSPLVLGIEATERALLSCFEKNGIKKIEPMDEAFNPNFHEVMFEAPIPNKASGIIIQVIEPGYVIHDRLLRPARVGVAKGGDESVHTLDTEA